jgi:DNA invertase Pin-like site-specific DNA recombinase
MTGPAARWTARGYQRCWTTRAAGDTLAVVRLDRLGRSLAELVASVAMLKERGIALLSLEEKRPRA